MEMPAPREPMAAENGCHSMTQDPWSFQVKGNRNTGYITGQVLQLQRKHKSSSQYLLSRLFLLEGERFFRGLLVHWCTVRMTRKGEMMFLIQYLTWSKLPLVSMWALPLCRNNIHVHMAQSIVMT